MTIHVTWPAGTVQAAIATPGSRTISGVAVPWNVPGRVSSGELVIFEPGSLDPAGRPVALRDHDRTRPIGTVADAVDTGQALEATIRVSATRDGDESLVLAGDGALPMLSVGADPIDYRYDDAGTMRIASAVWNELSLLTFGAFAPARVSTVTATRGGPVDPTLTDDPPDVDPVDDDPELEPNPDIEPDVTPDVETRAGRVPVTAGRPSRIAAGRHPYANVDMRALAGMLQAATFSGDQRLAAQINRIMTSPGARAASNIEAALADVTLVGTDNVGSVHRPAYQSELVEIVTHGAPLVEAIRQGDLQRGDYPNVTFNAWTKRPTVALQSAEKIAVNSVPLATSPTSVPVRTWATGNDISQQILDFGSPSFVEDYIRAAGVSYSEVIQTYAATTLLAAATNVATVVGDTFVQVVAKLVAGLNPALVPAGGFFLATSWDVYASMMGVTVNNGPAFWQGSMSFGSMLPSATIGGLSVFYAPGLPARTYLFGLRNAATWYDLPGTPYSLRAINVGQLGLDVAVYGYGACGIQYPAALVKTTQPST